MASLPAEVLSVARLYRLCSALVGADGVRTSYAKEYVRAPAGAHVLDIGCGPGDILRYLPDVVYEGYDLSAAYIEAARRTFGARGTFAQASVRDLAGRHWDPRFDVVLATAVLHHLPDDEASALFAVGAAALKPGGRLVTLDGCLRAGQHWFARALLARDRGRFVRDREGYLRLARGAFDDVTVDVREDLALVPYTYIIMECAAPRSYRRVPDAKDVLPRA